jgi:putative ubiquitin-RnfH superfamily antitoxin RatB of RatAB toxin-antitoxin module
MTTIAVEVVHSPAPRRVDRVALRLALGSTLADALAAAGLALQPDCGVWGRRVPLTHPLRDGDRVEVYRPLRADPKEARRLRYKGQRAPKTKRPASAGR